MSWIRNDIVIDFPLPGGIKTIIETMEQLDAAQDYSYYNWVDVLDCAAKHYVLKGLMTHKQWDTLMDKYWG